MKKFTRILLIIAVTITIASISVNAVYAINRNNEEITRDTEVVIVDSGVCGDNACWSFGTDNTLRVYGAGAMYDYNMHTNDMPWYNYNTEIKKIIIDEGVTYIGTDAFSYSAVQEVDIAFSVTEIGGAAFYSCDCLESVALHENITVIGRSAFLGTNLREVYVPASVSSISSYAFGMNFNLINIVVAEENENYCDINGVLFSKDGSVLYQYPTGRKGAYVVPDGTIFIGEGAFRYAIQLTDIYLGESIENIGNSAFSECSKLSTIYIGEKISVINTGFAEGCTNLTVIEVNEGNEYYCDIDGVLFNNEKTTLLMYPAGRDGVYSIPEGTERIAESAFRGGLISRVTFPNSLVGIQAYAFRSCNNLSEVIIPANVSSIGRGAFEYCSELINITFDNTSTILSNSVFNYCNENLMIYCHADTEVMQYAIKNNHNYVATEHNWNEKYTVDLKPTCTEEGSKSIHCAKCNATKDVTVIEKLTHEYGDWIIDKDSTCTEMGSRHKSCGCGDTITEGIISNGHSWGDDYTIDQEVSCTEEGIKSIHCSTCGIVDETTIIKTSAMGHTWDEGIAVEGDAGRVLHTCISCDSSFSAIYTTHDSYDESLGIPYGMLLHYDTALMGDSVEFCFDPNREAYVYVPQMVNSNSIIYITGYDIDGSRIFKIIKLDSNKKGSVSIDSKNESKYTFTVDASTKDISPSGHKWNDGENVFGLLECQTGAWKFTCQTCQKVEYFEVEGQPHDYSITEVIKPTCIEQGYTLHICSICNVVSYSDNYVDAKGHDFNDWNIVAEPTLTTTGLKIQECETCGEVVSVVLPAYDDTCHIGTRLGIKISSMYDQDYIFMCNGEVLSCELIGMSVQVGTGVTKPYSKTYAIIIDEPGSWDVNIIGTVSANLIYNVYVTDHAYNDSWVIDIKAGCVTAGSKSIHCALCNKRKDVTEIPALGHTWEIDYTVDKQPTCTEKGSKSIHCLVCDATKDSAAVEKLSHIYGNWIIDKEPTCTEIGSKYKVCECGDRVNEDIDAVGHEWEKDYTIDKTSTYLIPGIKSIHCSKCDTIKPDSEVELSLINIPFNDVSEDYYYYKPILWAIENGITAGVSAMQFAPDDPCTRGQIVTFLWRAAGKPSVLEDTGFTDVNENWFYSDAIKWAVKEGITAGTAPGKFSPDEPCTRGQVVTFLWRVAGKPKVSGDTGFADVDDNWFYADAVKWAVQEGITAGTGNGKFSPDDPCTRGQIVTFLYRYYV